MESDIDPCWPKAIRDKIFLPTDPINIMDVRQSDSFDDVCKIEGYLTVDNVLTDTSHAFEVQDGIVDKCEVRPCKKLKTGFSTTIGHVGVSYKNIFSDINNMLK